MEFKDIIQANATIIAGILVLLTISSFAGNSVKINPSLNFFWGSFIAFALSLVCAILGEFMIAMGVMKEEKNIKQFKGFSLITLGFGVMFLVYTIKVFISN